MSFSAEPSQTTVPKENLLKSVTPTYDVSLNGNYLAPKPIAPSSKPDDTGLESDTFHRLSFGSLSGLSGLAEDERLGNPASYRSRSPLVSHSPTTSKAWRAAFQRFWQRNRGLWLVTISQFFGASMNVATRVLELEGEGMQPLQVLFTRMGITAVLCCGYMWYTKVPYFPFGMKEVRPLLLVRGFAGFFGIFGMYYSLIYLPLSDATVITFLAPVLAGYGCYLFLGEPFTRTEQMASYVSLLGVVLISRPTSFFQSSSKDQLVSPPFPGPSNTTSHGHEFPVPTSRQRLGAIAVAMLGICGAAVAITVIRWIGKRAHPIISVNYFAVWCTLVSTIVLTTGSHLPAPFTSPDLRFALPASTRQWALLFFLGICGFMMQLLMTAGLAHEKSNRATNMVYTSMLFALLWDRVVFGTVPGTWSLLGSGLILGSAIYVAVQKAAGNGSRLGCDVETAIRVEEESAMLGDVDGLRESGGVPLIAMSGGEQGDNIGGRLRDET